MPLHETALFALHQRGEARAINLCRFSGGAWHFYLPFRAKRGTSILFEDLKATPGTIGYGRAPSLRSGCKKRRPTNESGFDRYSTPECYMIANARGFRLGLRIIP